MSLVAQPVWLYAQAGHGREAFRNENKGPQGPLRSPGKCMASASKDKRQKQTKKRGGWKTKMDLAVDRGFPTRALTRSGGSNGFSLSPSKQSNSLQPLINHVPGLSGLRTPHGESVARTSWRPVNGMTGGLDPADSRR